MRFVLLLWFLSLGALGTLVTVKLREPDPKTR